MNYRQAKKRAKKKGLPVPEKSFRGGGSLNDQIYHLKCMRADIVNFIRGDVIRVDENGEIVDSEETRKKIEEATAELQVLINFLEDAHDASAEEPTDMSQT